MKAIKNMQNKILLLSSVSVLLFSACTKDRPEQFSQGQGTNLQSISDYQDKVFDLEIGESIAPANITSAANIKVSEDVKSVNNFPLVSYKTNASLLGDIPLRAKAGKKYEIRYTLTNNFLKIVKVGQKEDLPFDEINYAEKLADGRYAVPLVGYRILSYYRIEHAKNENNENSHVLIEMPESDMNRATHFKVDFNSKTLFNPEDKMDVYPASIFEGEWFYSYTITAASSGQEDEIGMNYYNVDENFRPADKIKFLKSDRHIRAVNVNIDDRLDKRDEIHYKTVLTMPVEWLEYRARKTGTDTDLSEERVSTSKWSDRPYVKVAFDRVSTAVDDNEDAKLVDLELANNYLSFTLLRPRQGIRIKYSLLKATERNYVGKRHFESDFKSFGYFTTIKSVFKNFEMNRKEDFEKNVFISRFNPKQKEIVFHFTASSPNWLREIARQSIVAWDRSFQEAGTGMHIKLDESFDVALGDIRYNSINIVETLNDSGQTGFGGSITDPDSGEIISATANIYVTPSLAGITSDLRHYIYSQLGLYDENLIGKGSASLMNASANPKDSKKRAAFYKNILHTKVKSADALFLKQEKKEKAAHMDCRSMSITPSNILREINEHCSEMKDYIAELKEQNVTHNAREQSVLSSCARKVVLDDMLATLLHELGHNFGLRHNFTASNDVANFREKTDTASSVMDYVSDAPLNLGKYDIAAIRYGYADQIEDENGKVFPLKTNKSIKDNLAELGVQRKPYKFCTDDDVELGTDPLCARWDLGTTPLEVTENIIDRYNALYTTTNIRYDRYKMPDEDAFLDYKSRVTFEPLKRIYDQWRFHLAQYIGLGKEYLDELDPASYAKVLNAMSKDPVYSKYFKEYYPASRKAFEFLRDLSITPNKYCVVKTAEDDGAEVQLLELEKVRDDIYRSTGASVRTCRDEQAKNYFASKELTLLQEIGYHLNNVRYDLNLKSMDEPFDVVGNRYDRLLAFLALAQRSQDSIIHANKKFYPNFLDEPDLRADVANKLLPRIVNGLQLSAIDPKKPFIKFEYEKDLLASFVDFFRFGNMIPGKDRLNNNRDAAFQVHITTDGNDVQQAKAVTQTGQYYIAAMSPQNTVSSVMIKKHSQLVQLSEITDVNPKIFKDLKSFFDQLPSAKDADTITVKRFKEIMEQYAAAIEQSADTAKPHLYGLAATELQLYNGLVPYLEQLSAEDPKKAEELLNTSLSKVLEKQQFKFSFCNDLIQDRIKKYVTQIKQALAHYKNNKLDIDSQINLLENILIGR